MAERQAIGAAVLLAEFHPPDLRTGWANFKRETAAIGERVNFVAGIGGTAWRYGLAGRIRAIRACS